MGYYCYFRLEIIDKNNNAIIKGEQKHAIVREIYADTEMDPHGFSQDAINLDGESHNEAKWYDFHSHMTKISKNHPNLVFILGMEACAPDSEEEEGEAFFAFQNGDARNIYEPSFMQKASLFSSLDEVKEAALVMNLGEYTDIVFKLPHEKTLDLIYDQLKASSFAEQTDKTLTIMSFGGSGSSVTVRIQPEQEQDFWQEAERVLVQ